MLICSLYFFAPQSITEILSRDPRLSETATNNCRSINSVPPAGQTSYHQNAPTPTAFHNQSNHRRIESNRKTLNFLLDLSAGSSQFYCLSAKSGHFQSALTGRCPTVISRPISSANFCNSTFHNFTREPLLPPPSAVIINLFASG